MKEPQRIAKLLARAGVASRREIERMIGEGRVAIGGTAIETPATLITSLHGVTVDGKPVAEPDAARLFLYHKPAGLLTAERDPGGRPTIYDRMPEELPRVIPVGRLDLNTEGLLLLTTDGELKRALELPANGVERTYRARAYGPVTQAMLESLSEGIEIEGIRYGSIDANIERRTGANVWIEMRLKEGKNREVRRVLEHLGLTVNRLIRVAYGPFVLGDLPIGEAGEVRQRDLVAFRRTMRGGGGAESTIGAEIAMPRASKPASTGRPPHRGAGDGGARAEGRAKPPVGAARKPVAGRPERSAGEGRRATAAMGDREERSGRPHRPRSVEEHAPRRPSAVPDRERRGETTATRRASPMSKPGRMTGRAANRASPASPLGKPGRGTGRTADRVASAASEGRSRSARAEAWRSGQPPREDRGGETPARGAMPRGRRGEDAGRPERTRSDDAPRAPSRPPRSPRPPKSPEPNRPGGRRPRRP